MGVKSIIPLQWASFLCVACAIVAFSKMADSATTTISDQTSYNSPSTCQYPCLPPPASVTNCPPPPPPSSSSTYSPPYQPGPGYYYPPPAGYYPPLFPSYQAPPPPDPILPYFPFLYRHPPPSFSSSTILVYAPIRSLAMVTFALCFVL